MRKETFIFQNQEWVAQHAAEMTFLLTHDTGRTRDLSVMLDATFLPAWVMALPEGRDTEEEHRRMNLSVHAFLPELESWRALAGLVIEEQEELLAPDGSVLRPGMTDPDVNLWSSGDGPESIHNHARQEAHGRLVFGRWQESLVVEYEVEAFYRSPRGQEEVKKQMDNLVREWFDEPPVHEINEARLEEGYTLRHKGVAEFDHVLCTVPVNAPDPIGYAQKLARRQLGMEKFGWCYVNGGKMDGTWEPEHGLTPQGRLVKLSPHTLAYEQWKAQRERR